jgi:hypothetical protein
MMRRVFSGHVDGALTTLAFSAMGRRLIADTGTAKSSPAQQLGALKWPFLALWPLAVAPGMPAAAPQCTTQVAPRQTRHRRSKFLYPQGPLTALTALRSHL